MVDVALQRAQALLARAQDANARRRPRLALDRYDRLARALPPDATGEWAAVRVQVLVGRASCLLEMGGDAAASLALLTEAVDAAVGADAEPLRAAVLGQRALIHQRVGRHDEALVDFAAGLRSAPAPRDRMLLHLNRGSLRLELGEYPGAAQDFEASAAVALEIGDTLRRGMVLHNLGYVRYLGGDLPGALREMDAAAELMPEEARTVAYLDQAEVLLEAGLLTDADEVLGRAADLVRASRMTRDLAEIELTRSRCRLALGRFDDARRLASAARRRFARLGGDAWVARCDLVVLQARLAAQQEAPRRAVLAAVAADARALRDRVGDGSAPGFTGLSAVLVESEALLALDDVAAARELLATVPRRVATAPLAVQVQLQVARAHAGFSEGDRAAGIRAVRRGFALLAAHRSRMGSVESVTATAVHGAQLNRLDVTAALATGRPGAVFDALERGRAVFTGTGRVHPPADEVAAELLAQARSLVVAARAVPPDAPPEALAEQAELLRRARAVQDSLRHRAWRHDGDTQAAGPQDAVTAAQVVRALRERDDGGVLVSLLAIGGVLHLIRLSASGTSVVEAGPVAQVAEAVRRVRADLGVVSNELIPAPLRAVARASLERGLRRLDALLVEPLQAVGDLHVVARDPFLAVPWSSLPSRRGLRTSVNSHVARSASAARPAGEHRVLAAAGPRVDHGDVEVRAVARTWPGARMLLGGSATTGAVRAALADHDVVHLAAHGRHDADNPLFASVDLVDGPLFAHELDGTRLPGSVVVLSSCEVGGATSGPGGEVLGLTSVLLRLGARAVVASVAPLSDRAAAQVTPLFHEALRRSDDPAGALAAALADAGEPVPLVCFGPAPGLRG